MTGIVLTVFISDKYKDEAISREIFEEAVDHFVDLWEELPTSILMAIDAADGDDGNTYHELLFRPTSRFMLNGERWFSDGVFTVSVDQLLRVLKSEVAS